VPDFLLRAHPGDVELTLLGDRMAITVLPPAMARRLAVNLELFADRAEVLSQDPGADVPREGEVKGSEA
jgi:hypothetical protein